MIVMLQTYNAHRVYTSMISFIKKQIFLLADDTMFFIFAIGRKVCGDRQVEKIRREP